MGTNRVPPFLPGSTYGTTDITDGVEWEGFEMDFPADWTPASGSTLQSNRSYGVVRRRIVRNLIDPTGTNNLPPKRVVALNDFYDGNGVAGGSTTPASGGATGHGQIASIARVAAATKGYPVDEFLPSTGVAYGDLCWITVKGRAKVVTSNATITAVTPGSFMHIVTATTTANSNSVTTGGKVDVFAATATSDAYLATHVVNMRALETLATTATNTDLLVEVLG